MAHSFGKLWKRINKEGEEFFVGFIDLGLQGKVNLIVLRNNNKSKEQHSDFNILKRIKKINDVKRN